MAPSSTPAVAKPHDAPAEKPAPRSAAKKGAGRSTSLARSLVLPFLAAAYYILTSTSLTIFIKILFSKFETVHAPVLLLCQAVTAVTILLALRALGRFTPPDFSTWTLSSLRAYAPLYACSITMLLTAMLSLKLTSLVMYNTLRRAGMVFVVAIHALLNRTRPPLYTLAATALVTSGAVFASSTDLAFDPLGYWLAFMANLSTAVYLVLVAPVRKALGISNIQLVFVNALANIPVLTIICLIWPPKADLLHSFESAQFSIMFFCSCVLAMLINHSTFVNTTVNDAIAQSVSSQLKDVMLLIVSVAFIDDAASRAKGNLRGVLIGFIGSLVYGLGKLYDRLKQQTEEPTVASGSNEQATVDVRSQDDSNSSDSNPESDEDVPLVRENGLGTGRNSD